mgnify:CR=1 FL=1|jgi:hypothetical protein
MTEEQLVEIEARAKSAFAQTTDQGTIVRLVAEVRRLQRTLRIQGERLWTVDGSRAEWPA